MGGLAGIVRWGNEAVKEREIRLMLDRIPHRAPDGSQIDLASGVGFGHAKLALSKRDRIEPGIVWNHDRTLGIVADARIYNRALLSASLALDKDCGDAELLLSGYLRWGHSLLNKLEGDFSFAIVDREKDQLFAARDIVGAKPFFYSFFPDRLVFGSEPKELLGLPFGVRPHPDRLEIARYLMGQLYTGERTVWKSIKRLKPGHFLLATADNTEQKAFWKPNFAIQSHFHSYEEYISSIRESFLESVSRRIISDSTVAIHVSGGYDSSSIALMAEEITQKTNKSPTSLIALSVTYAEKEVDESIFIEAVRERLSYPMHLYEASKIDNNVDLAAQAWRLDSPAVDIETARDLRAVKIMKETRSRVLITGFGGDDIFWEPDYGKDLLSRGRLLRFMTWYLNSNQPPLFYYVKRKLRKYLQRIAPQVLEIYSRLMNRKRIPPESQMLSEDLRELLASPLVNDTTLISGNFDSHAQKQLFEWMNCSRLHWCIEHLEACYAQHSIEVRHPFLDKALMEILLSLPLDVRLKNKRRLKPILQEIMAENLPESVLSRNNKATFDRYYINLLNGWTSKLNKLVDLRGNLKISQFIAKKISAIIPADQNMADYKLWKQVRPFWALVTLEIWMRGFEKYDSKKHNNAAT